MIQLAVPARIALGSLLLALAVFAVYFPGLTGDFLFDDFANIVTNKKIQIERVDLPGLLMAAGAYDGPLGRPLATVGFAVDYVVGGRSPFPFKVHSLLVHAANTVLVLILCMRLLPLAGMARWAPWAVAALWAVHPLQVSTVLYIVQRMEILATFFVLLGLIAYLKGRFRQMEGRQGWSWIIASVLVSQAGLLAKESAILFPLYALALELTVLRFAASRSADGTWLKRAYALAITVGVLGYFLVVVPRYGAPGAFDNRDFSLYERILTQFRILPMYLEQILLPLPGNMTFYYDNIARSTGLMSPPSTLYGLLFIAALLLVSWIFRKKVPMASLGIFWFFASHSLTSGAVNLELAFEHRNYFPLLGVLLTISAIVAHAKPRISKEAGVTMVVSAIVMVAALCGIRAASWGNPLVLAMEMVSRNPDSSRASSDLGAVYARLAMDDPSSHFLDFALNEFERGAAIPGASPLPEQGLILLSSASGRPIQPVWWEQLHHKLRTNPIGPQEAMSVTGLLSERLKGTELDDQQLATAYGILAERGGATAEAYLGFANHAENFMHDDALAEQLYVAAMASETMTPEYAQQVLFALATEGKERFFEAAGQEAARRGLVGVQ